MLANLDLSRVSTSTVQCANGMDAFLALPNGSGRHPTIVLLHERYGLVQHTRDLAVRFASEGYATIAPNLFFREADQVAIARGEANGALVDEQVCDDMDAARAHLHGLSLADVQRMVAMGVCATGRHPLVYAARRADLAACLVFYGGATHEAGAWESLALAIARSKAPVLGIFGEDDHVVSVPDVLALRDALERAQRSYHMRIFREVPHGWLNDTMPGRYRAEAAEEAWGLTREFLARVQSGAFAADRVQWRFESDVDVEYDFTTKVRQA